MSLVVDAAMLAVSAGLLSVESSWAGTAATGGSSAEMSPHDVVSGQPAVRVTEVEGGLVLGHCVVVARTPVARLRGLLGRAALSPGEGLLLRPCNGIHTLGMRFAIDVLFLDAEGLVIRVEPSLQPGRMVPWVRGARQALELSSGGRAGGGCHPRFSPPDRGCLAVTAWWLLLIPAVLGAFVDLRVRRIPNAIVIPSIVVVLLLSWLQGAGWAAAAGMSVAAVAGIVARVAAGGGFGAGDVKLLASGGAVVGLAGVRSLLLGTAIGGGALGLAYLVRAGRGASVPYGVAITLGMGMALATAS